MSCNVPCVAACAVDSQGRDACREEGGNKRNQLQRSFLSPPPHNARRHETHYLDGIRQHPSQYWTTYDDNDDPQSNMPPARKLPASRFPANPKRKIFFFFKNPTYKKERLVSQSGLIWRRLNYLLNQICLLVCPSILTSIFHRPWVPILSFP